jgi:hypothetical protein
MPAELFDMELRALRRDRAFRGGGELFLLERVFEDCLDRLGLLQQSFGSALLIGCPDPAWPHRLRDFAREVVVLDPGLCFAEAAGGSCVVEDELELAAEQHDLCVALGTLDTVNDLPQALTRIRAALAPSAFFLGAIAGGDTLPQLRSAMRAADQVQGFAVPHVHPRIESAMLASLLSGAGFANPVVDVDRVQVSYEDLGRLVHDLRAMGATNILKQRPSRSMSRAARQAAIGAFAAAGQAGRTVETFEILNFAAWTPA